MEMKQIVIATKNKNKLLEIKEILKDMEIEVLSIRDFANIPEIEEDGESYQENAIKKAEEIFSFTKITTLSDDSGLEVDALSGQPGIYSSSFAGKGKSDEENNKKLLGLLENVPPHLRGATFKCVIAVRTGDEMQTFAGECKGEIISKPRGSRGFGYDPLFFIPHYNQTIAELHPHIKNRISHRGVTLEKAKEYLRKAK